MKQLNYKNNFNLKVEKFFLLCFAIGPLFVITIPKWMNAMMFINAALAIFLLFSLNFKETIGINASGLKRWLQILVITFCAPFLATFLSQLIKNHWLIADYDSPVRFLLAIPILLIAIYRQLFIFKYWKLVFPLVLIATFILLPILPKTGWGNDPTRLTTSFVDPLTFGRICLTFGLISLFTLDIKKNPWFLSLIQLSGIVVGIYLSIRSGSRTGWLALGPVLIFFITTLFEKNRLKAFIFACVVTFIGIFAIYQQSSTVKERVDLAVNEIKTYKIDEMNPDNSVGMRISFFRMGLYYFGLAPFSGLNQAELQSHRDDPEISKFASEFTRQFPINAMFHNEFMTNAVRHGIWGIISTSLLFFVPLGLFIFSAVNSPSSRLPLLGIAYIMCELISGMSTEVFSLKFIASLYAFVMAGLCSSTLILLYSKKQP